MFLLKLNGILFILILLKLIFIQNTEGVDVNENENEINKEMVEKEFKIYKKLPFEEVGSNRKKSKKGKNRKNKEEKGILKLKKIFFWGFKWGIFKYFFSIE
ncbi:unnamed protein product [Meloidogyne enterolobii]|uniref:Uncharacterized protein n=1 Tax=Meloidogyne enterolobii TaxID=390850 RepID=A0ACB0Y967_MELEN